MKKWQRKKKIPKGIYCGKCPHRFWLNHKKMHSNPPDKSYIKCKYSETCFDKDKCHSKENPATCCVVNVVGCRFMRYVDNNEESLLWDGCKECGVHDN